MMKGFDRVIRLEIALLSLLLVTGAGDCALAQQGEYKPALKIYYVPFRVETFVPITTEDIEAQSDLVIWIYDNDPLVSEIISLFKGEKPSKEIRDVPVGHLNIRLKIENLNDGTAYFVDKGGILQTNKGDRFLLSPSQIEKIEAKITSLRGVVHKNIDRFLKYDVEHYS